MNESTLTNLDRTPEYIRINTHSFHTPTMNTTNIDHNSKSIYNEIHIFNSNIDFFYFRKIIVQNPFENPSNTIKYIHDPLTQHNMPVVQSSHQTSNDLSVSMNNMQTSRSIIIPQQNLSNQYPVRFNQELLHNFGINIPTSRQAEAKEASLSPSISTSLVPLPTSLSNNLGINNIHHMNQPSITPTIIGTYPIRHPVLHNSYISSNSLMGKVTQQIRSSNGISPNVVNYPTMIQTQQLMRPRMIHPNTYELPSQVIMPQQSSKMYDSNINHQANAQQFQDLSSDNNSLKSMLQMNSQINSQTKLEPKKTLISNDHPQGNIPIMATNKAPKVRRKRKANDSNVSLEDDVPTKSRKRKKKGIELTEHFVEHSLQQLRNLPTLIPLEPSIDKPNELPLPFKISDKTTKHQGEFGHVFIENMNDCYRPNRQYRSISPTKSSSTLERHFRLCSNFVDQPPTLPSPPLMKNSSEQLFELTKEQNDLYHNESIISTSTLADDENYINDIETENKYLLKTLFSPCDKDLRLLSPILLSHENDSSAKIDQSNETTIDKPSGDNRPENNDRPLVQGTDKVSVTLTLTTEAANNVQSVMAAVADLLKMAYPSTFDVQQTLDDKNCTCSSTINSPNSSNFLSHSQISSQNHGTSIYRVGRETNVNIQSLIDMQQKICRYCSNNLTTENSLKKRLNEFPLYLREISLNSEPFINFCNEQCYNAYLTNLQLQQQQQTVSVNIKNEPVDRLPSLPIQNSSIKHEDENLIQLSNNKRWKRWNSNLSIKLTIQSTSSHDIDRFITDIKIPLALNAQQDKRICVFCNVVGDMTSDGPGRLLNLNIGQWCHLNCALWSFEVYETVSGSLMCVDQAFKRSINTECIICKQKGGSLKCIYQRCTNTYHFTCATDNGCVFYKTKSIMCPTHASPTVTVDQILEDKSVLRKIWIDRDEIKQIQNYMNEEHDDKSYILRIGSLILHNIGQLLPHQLQSSTFHNRSFIYPVGYTVTRLYWSMYRPNHRCAYKCSIIDIDNKPMFRISVQENENEPVQEFVESSARAVWYKIIHEIDLLRKKYGLVKMFPVFVKGEDLYGLTEPHIIRLIESLPGVEMLQNYAFKYGRLQLFDMPLTLNPTGCARSEPKLRTHFQRHAQALATSHSTRSNLPRTLYDVQGNQTSYGKHFVISKSTQYRKLKIEWRQNIYLAKSRIQGLGLFAARDLEKHTMIIEYIGELIRNEVANKREKLYEQQNRGIYMFRLDDDHVVDATMSGCLARYINHSCEPNAITEVVQVEKENKIVIITNRRILKGEEIMYDYKFNFEDDSKIPCLCGALNCRKWMN
ncbi:unnamed protein product [Rotaria magnacalcarata]|uniref:Histone-lysine N-methyltransferase n=1 Tax=Rotaria magnacalcarata TaxID=392030 RepID=A0A816RMZ3_9BILA|nr:unnamed protein product [Rotaria magnacalcarata]CAF2157631.1 unnamed protein product [Rotaria magnacalcarata]